MAYRQAEELLYRRRDVDLSAYRFQLRQVYHVAVLGTPPPQDVAETIDRLLASGEPATLPADVVRALAQRREHESRRGPWVEKHHRPGEPL